MSSIQTEDSPESHNFELNLYEKLAQLQYKEEALEKSEAKLTESKNLVCKLQILLENERRISNQVRTELKSAMELIVHLEDEKIHGQTERAQLDIKYQNARISQDNLVNQARRNKLENVLLQRKNEILEANLLEQKLLNQVITESVNDLRNQINQLYPIIQSNVEKLEQEQKYLNNTFQSVIEFKRRFADPSRKFGAKQSSINKNIE